MNASGPEFALTRHQYVEGLEYGTFKEAPLCIQFNIDSFSPSSRSFRGINIGDVPRSTQTALSAFSLLVSKPKMNYAEDEEANESLTFINNTGIHSRTRQFLECVKGEDGITTVAWRIWIFVCDPTLDMGQGIVNLINENIKENEKNLSTIKKGATVPTFEDEHYRELLSVEKWIANADIYVNGINNEVIRGQRLSSNHFYNIERAESPAHPFTVFSPQNAFAISLKEKTKACLSQRTQNSYFTFNEGLEMRDFQFPHPHLVFPIESQQMHPHTICGILFPPTTCIDVLPETPSVNPNAGLGDNSTKWTDAITKTKQGDGNEKVLSDMKRIAQVAKPEFLGVMELDDEEERFDALKTLRSKALEDFLRVWNANSELSEPSIAAIRWSDSNVNKYFEKNGNHEMSYSRQEEFCQPYDTSLSPFANMIIRTMDDLENVFEVSTCHSEMMMVLFRRGDCFRRRKALHFNIILCGAGGASKSFILLLLEKLGIKGTNEVITHETTMANQIDRDQNDIDMLYHELPTRLLGMDKNLSSQTGDGRFKDRLTRGETMSKVFVRHENGKRDNVQNISECIGCLVGASNDPPSRIPEALRSRFYLAMMSTITRKGRRPIDFAAAEVKGVQHNLVAKKIFHYQVQQYLVMIVEKMIWAKALPDVSLGIASAIWEAAGENLNKLGINTNVMRNYERLQAMARQLTILNAIELTFHIPGMNHYGKPFKPELVADVAPYLICTEEIAAFAMIMLSSQYVNHHEQNVVGQMAYGMAGYAPQTDTGREFMNQNEDEDGKVRSVRYVKHNVSKSEEEEDDANTDYNYLHIGDTIHQVSTDTSIRMKGETMSPENIRFMIEAMMTRTMMCKERDAHGNYSGPSTEKPVMVRKRVNNQVFIHLLVAFVDKVLSDDFPSVIENAVKETCHRFTRERRVLSANNMLHAKQDKMNLVLPNVLRVMEFKKMPNKTLYLSNDIGNNGSVPRRLEVTDDLEIIKIGDFLFEQGITNVEREAVTYFPDFYEEKYKKLFPDAPNKVYPKNLIDDKVDQLKNANASMEMKPRFKRQRVN